jgi:hypothetical protein
MREKGGRWKVGGSERWKVESEGWEVEKKEKGGKKKGRRKRWKEKGERKRWKEKGGKKKVDETGGGREKNNTNNSGHVVPVVRKREQWTVCKS